MPNLVRLPAEVPDGEMRVYWDRSEEGSGLHVWGPERLRRWFLCLVTDPRIDIRATVGVGDRMRLMQTVLERQPSVVEALKAKGFDESSFVFSIRREGMGVPPVVLPDDVRTRLEEAQVAIGTLREAIAAHEEVKGVYVVDESDKSRIDEALDGVVTAVAAALDLASGDAPQFATVAQAPADPEPAPNGATPMPFGREVFDRVMKLRWEDVSGDEPEDGVCLSLFDKELHVGSVYERDDGRFGWQCFPSDWRSSETDLQAARDQLMNNYVEHYVHEARELVRAHVPRT